MRYGLILNILGTALKIFSLMFLIPVVVALILKEYNDILPFAISSIITLIVGQLLLLNNASKKEIDNIKKTESLASVLLVWFIFGLSCTIPYLFYGMNLTDACFEAFSGVTTTGSTIMKDFSIYSKTLFFFRSCTQWFGGMGIVVLFIAVLPKIAVAGRQMFYAEIPAPTQDKATPRIRYTASWLWGIYLAITLFELIALRFLNVDWYDATLLSMSTVATGGFSSMPGSICDFNCAKISLCILIFMFISGMNYILIYRSLKSKKITPIFKSEEFIAYLKIIAFISAVLSLSLYLNNHFDIKKAILDAFFQVTACVNSTGFVIDNYSNWDILSKAILFSAFFIGGCATSSSGGIKIIRWVFIGKYLKREFNKIIHPQGVYPIKLEGSPISADIISQMVAFIIFYFVIMLVGAFLLLLIEHDATLALTTSASAIANIGPSFGSIGALGTYADLETSTKWILITLMVIGRLEIIPFLAILNKDLWKD